MSLWRPVDSPLFGWAVVAGVAGALLVVSLTQPPPEGGPWDVLVCGLEWAAVKLFR